MKVSRLASCRRWIERAVQVPQQILDVKAGLLLQQAVHRSDNLDQIRDGGIPFSGTGAHSSGP
jgi:hypothetical protein